MEATVKLAAMTMGHPDMNESLRTIDEWYRRKADGEWEHINGITIESADNPGWVVKVISPGHFPEAGLPIGTDLSSWKCEGQVTPEGLVLFSEKLEIVVVRTAELLWKYGSK